jgi:peptidoglycan/LPS O-acetylase OafA/YrhL
MVEVYGYSIATIPLITSAVYGVIEFFKYFVFGNREIWKKYIPLIASVIGAIMAICLYFFSPEALPIPTWYAALVMGCASGLSAVGVNQIKKQMSNGGDKGGS